VKSAPRLWRRRRLHRTSVKGNLLDIERNENRIHELLRQNVELELKYVRGDGAFDAVVERVKEGM
jgi:transposase